MHSSALNWKFITTSYSSSQLHYLSISHHRSNYNPLMIQHVQIRGIPKKNWPAFSFWYFNHRSLSRSRSDLCKSENQAVCTRLAIRLYACELTPLNSISRHSLVHFQPGGESYKAVPTGIRPMARLSRVYLNRLSPVSKDRVSELLGMLNLSIGKLVLNYTSKPNETKLVNS